MTPQRRKRGTQSRKQTQKIPPKELTTFALEEARGRGGGGLRDLVRITGGVGLGNLNITGGGGAGNINLNNNGVDGGGLVEYDYEVGFGIVTRWHLRLICDRGWGYDVAVRGGAWRCALSLGAACGLQSRPL